MNKWWQPAKGTTNTWSSDSIAVKSTGKIKHQANDSNVENRPTSTICFSTNQHQMTVWPSSTPPGGAEQWLHISQQVAAAKCQTQTSLLTPTLSHSADYPRGTTVLCSETWTQINGSCFWEIKAVFEQEGGGGGPADSQAVDLQNKCASLESAWMQTDDWKAPVDQTETQFRAKQD